MPVMPGFYIRPGPQFDSETVWYIHCRDFWDRAECLDRLTDVQQWMCESALARGDRRQAWAYLREWRAISSRTVRISKFDPGDHFYVLDVKFNSYEEAHAHAEDQGYEVIPGVRSVGVPRGGD